MPGSPPCVPQIPSKWQEQKHNNVLSNHTHDHTEPFNRKKDVLVRHILVLPLNFSWKVGVLHPVGTAIVSLAEHFVMTSTMKIYYLIKNIMVNN